MWHRSWPRVRRVGPPSIHPKRIAVPELGIGSPLIVRNVVGVIGEAISFVRLHRVAPLLGDLHVVSGSSDLERAAIVPKAASLKVGSLLSDGIDWLRELINATAVRIMTEAGRQSGPVHFVSSRAGDLRLECGSFREENDHQQKRFG